MQLGGAWSRGRAWQVAVGVEEDGGGAEHVLGRGAPSLVIGRRDGKQSRPTSRMLGSV
jgi:hypothetical protein